MSEKITLKKALKVSSEFSALILVVKMVDNLIFKFDKVSSFFHDIAVSNQKVLVIVVTLLTVFFVWVMLSLIIAIIYYIYSRVKNR